MMRLIVDCGNHRVAVSTDRHVLTGRHHAVNRNRRDSFGRRVVRLRTTTGDAAAPRLRERCVAEEAVAKKVATASHTTRTSREVSTVAEVDRRRRAFGAGNVNSAV